MAINDLLASVQLLAVREALGAVYPPYAATNYAEIVSRFRHEISRADRITSHLLGFFNPEDWKTAKFYDGINKYSHVSVESVVDAILKRHSIPQEILAKGIMSTHLNLPPQVYAALEVTYLPVWRKIGPKSALVASGIGGGDLDYVSGLYRASQRYEVAVGAFRKAVRLTKSRPFVKAPG